MKKKIKLKISINEALFGIYFQDLYLLLILILAFISAFIIIKQINRTEIKVPIVDWESNYISYHAGWYIDEDIIKTNRKIDMITGPGIELEKGAYSIKINYECEEDQECVAYADQGDEAYIKDGIHILSKDQKCISYDCILLKDITDFQVVIKYNGKGSLKIEDIDIKPTMVHMKRKLFNVFLLFLVVGAGIYLWKLKRKRTILFVAILFLMLLVVGETLSHAGGDYWVEMEDVRKYPDSYDVCFIGPSTAMENNMNQELYEQYGIAGITLGEMLQPIYVARYTLEEMLQYQSPEVVFFDTGALFYNKEIDARWSHERRNYLLNNFLSGIKTLSIRKEAFQDIQNYTANIDISDYLTNQGNSHSNWKYITDFGLEKDIDTSRLHGSIFLMTIGDSWGNTYDESAPNEIRVIDEDIEEYLSEMIEMCKAKDIDFVLLTERTTFTKAEHNAVDILAEKYGVKHIDINEHIEEIGLDYDRDYHDAIHFNLSGAIKCSDFLGKYLSEHYNIEDKRGNPDYERYEEQREYFQAQKEIMAATPTPRKKLPEQDKDGCR